MRANADLVACTYQTQDRAIETISKDYADVFEHKDNFKELIKANTQDYQMLIIDQTEAKFGSEDVFFTDMAEEEPEAYKVGGYLFWKESGCKWKEQLWQYDNLKTLFKDKDKEHWMKLGEELVKKDQEAEKNEEEFEEDNRMVTNMEGLAPDKVQENKMMAYRKENQIGYSHWQRAGELKDKLFRYVPGPPTNDNFYRQRQH